MCADPAYEAFHNALDPRHHCKWCDLLKRPGEPVWQLKFKTLLSEVKARLTISAGGNPYDNAWTESFIGNLKNEMLQNGVFIDESDTRTKLFSYIDGYYNTHRKIHHRATLRRPNSNPNLSTKINQMVVRKSVTPQWLPTQSRYLSSSGSQ